MVMKEWGVEHVSWKEGWPQPGVVEKGKGGVDWNGGHGEGCVFVVLLVGHVCVDVGKSIRMRKGRRVVKDMVDGWRVKVWYVMKSLMGDWLRWDLKEGEWDGRE